MRRASSASAGTTRIAVRFIIRLLTVLPVTTKNRRLSIARFGGNGARIARRSPHPDPRGATGGPMVRIVRRAWAVTVVALVLPVAMLAQGRRAAPVTVFDNARLILGDGSAPVEQGRLVVQGGRILAEIGRAHV